MAENNHTRQRLEQENSESIKHALIRSVVPTGTFTLFALNVFTASVVAANNSTNGTSSSAWTGVFCSQDILGQLVSIAGQLIIVMAIVFAILTFALGALVEAAPMIGQEGVARAKRMQSNAMAGGAKAFGIPAVLIAAFDASGVGLPSCVNILPF